MQHNVKGDENELNNDLKGKAVDFITAVSEAREAMTGLDEEFGESFGDMVSRMRADLGENVANDMLLGIMKSFGSYDDNPERVQEWYDIQVPLLPKIDGLEISKHVFDPEEPGACLFGKFGRYSLEIGIEDARTKEAFKYYTVHVEDSERSEDGEIVFHTGVVFSDIAASRVGKLLASWETEPVDIGQLVKLINSKYHDAQQGWVDTPECQIRKITETAKNRWYTAQINVGPCECPEKCK